jgi:hypothetical protein
MLRFEPNDKGDKKMKSKKILNGVLALAGCLTLAGFSAGQDTQQKAAAAKEAAARNQQALRSYSWTTTTKLSLKGEVKNTKIESCQYGPDGKVQKTELSEPPPPPEKEPGRKGRRKEKVVAKKTGEMKETLEASAALVQSYVPPAPEKIQAAMAAGKVTVTPGAGAAIRFADFNKAGDSLTLTMDSESKSMRQIAVDTWLDKPDKKVTLAVTFESLPDGTNYAAQTVLSIPGDKIEVRIENSNYKKLAP